MLSHRFGVVLTHITHRTHISELPMVYHWPLSNTSSSLQYFRVEWLATDTHYPVCPSTWTQGDPLSSPTLQPPKVGGTQREIVSQQQHYIHVLSWLWSMWWVCALPDHSQTIWKKGQTDLVQILLLLLPSLGLSCLLVVMSAHQGYSPHWQRLNSRNTVMMA